MSMGFGSGGVVLAVAGGRVEVEETLRKHGALVVERIGWGGAGILRIMWLRAVRA